MCRGSRGQASVCKPDPPPSPLLTAASFSLQSRDQKLGRELGLEVAGGLGVIKVLGVQGLKRVELGHTPLSREYPYHARYHTYHAISHPYPATYHVSHLPCKALALPCEVPPLPCNTLPPPCWVPSLYFFFTLGRSCSTVSSFFRHRQNQEKRNFNRVGTDRIGYVWVAYVWAGASDESLQPTPRSRPKMAILGAPR